MVKQKTSLIESKTKKERNPAVSIASCLLLFAVHLLMSLSLSTLAINCIIYPVMVLFCWFAQMAAFFQPLFIACYFLFIFFVLSFYQLFSQKLSKEVHFLLLSLPLSGGCIFKRIYFCVFVFSFSMYNNILKQGCLKEKVKEKSSPTSQAKSSRQSENDLLCFKSDLYPKWIGFSLCIVRVN